MIFLDLEGLYRYVAQLYEPKHSTSQQFPVKSSLPLCSLKNTPALFRHAFKSHLNKKLKFMSTKFIIRRRQSQFRHSHFSAATSK